MSISNFTEYNLAKNSYASFDATTLKELIIARLNESDVFKDQSYEGSNINAFIDVVAYMYHVLLFYLNTTSSESTFTTAELYENINKLVSNLGYKPTGAQTSLVNVSLSGAAALAQGNYTIKKFSFVAADGIFYTTLRDISFEKTVNAVEGLSVDNSILTQGYVTEHPQYVATGENFEVVTVVNNSSNASDTRFISDNTFTIFVRDSQTNIWSEWTETSSLFLGDSTSTLYEKRLNENGNYEFKFGNNINGKSLNEGDTVQIYYVTSDGSQGVIGNNVIDGNYFVLYNTPTFQDISSYIYSDVTSFIQGANLSNVLISNPTASSDITPAESVADIKANAPKIFSLQNRLVTASDYETFITKNFNNVLKSVKIIDNDYYTNNVVRYYYDIGLNTPSEDCRVLFNQVAFANSTSFNNVYVVPVPKIATILNDKVPNYVNASQKQFIINECNLKKDLTHNIVIIDPVYKAFNLGLQVEGESECVDLKDKTYLVIKKDVNAKISVSALKSRISNVFKTYFEGVELGELVNISTITNEILNIEGVTGIFTRRTDVGFEVPRISVVVWNPLYDEDDVSFTSQNVNLKSFQFPYFYDISDLSNRIIIENE